MTPLEIDRNALQPAFLRRYHPTSVRSVLFQRFLDFKGSNYERVLMANAGQAFFQNNPFDVIGEPGKKKIDLRYTLLLRPFLSHIHIHRAMRNNT